MEYHSDTLSRHLLSVLLSQVQSDLSQRLPSSLLRLPTHLSDIEVETLTYNLCGRTMMNAEPSSMANPSVQLSSGMPIALSQLAQVEGKMQTRDSSDDTLVDGEFADEHETLPGATPIPTYEVRGMMFVPRPFLYETPTRQAVITEAGHLQTLTGISPSSPSRLSFADHTGSFNQVVPQVQPVDHDMVSNLLDGSLISNFAFVHQEVATDDSPTTQRQISLPSRSHRVRGLDMSSTSPARRQRENDENQPVGSNAEQAWNSERVTIDVASPLAVRHELQYLESIALLQR